MTLFRPLWTTKQELGHDRPLALASANDEVNTRATTLTRPSTKEPLLPRLSSPTQDVTNTAEHTQLAPPLLLRTVTQILLRRAIMLRYSTGLP